jgi:RNA polymerase sigma-70 factor, ECF subfamily
MLRLMSTSNFPFTHDQAAAVDDDLLVTALHGCARSSVPALQRLYGLTAPRLLGLLLQMLGDRRDAEQALPECYLRIWNHAITYSAERCRPLPWLLGMARQYAITRLRDTQAAVDADEVDASLRLADAALHAGETPPPARALQRQLAGLNADDQRLLRLVYVTGRAPAEVARALSEPISPLRRRLRNCLAALQEGLAS